MQHVDRLSSVRFLALLFAALIGCASCRIGPAYQIYGTDLETRARTRAFLWPRDSQGERYSYVLEQQHGGMGRVRTYSQAAFAKVDLGGATIVLPPSASNDQRRAAWGLLEGLARNHGNLSTHLVVSGSQWTDVATTDQLVERVREARDIASSYADFDPVAFFEALLGNFAADLVLLPRTGSDEFLSVATTHWESLFPDPNYEPTYDSLSVAQILGFLREPLPPQASPRPYRWALVLVPSDAPPEDRRRCNELVLQLLEQGGDDWTVTRRISAVARSEQLVSPDALVELRDPLTLEPFGEEWADIRDTATYE